MITKDDLDNLNIEELSEALKLVQQTSKEKVADLFKELKTKYGPTFEAAGYELALVSKVVLPPTKPKGVTAKGEPRKQAAFAYPNPDNKEDLYIPGKGKPPSWWKPLTDSLGGAKKIEAWKKKHRVKNPNLPANPPPAQEES